MLPQILLALLLAVLLDLAFGEPPEKVHPTVLMGKAAEVFSKAVPSKKGRPAVLWGGIMLASIAGGSALAAYLALGLFGGVFKVAAGAVLLKASFSWRALHEHVKLVAEEVEEGDTEGTRSAASRIVGRDTSELEEGHLLSAAVESAGESLPDGIVSPLFYYLLFSPFGLHTAVAASIFFRGVSTLDSTIGYSEYFELGCLPAKADDVLNFLPARLSALLILASAFLLKMDWKGAIRVLRRDRKNTPSPNSGWPMSALAGALGIRLEKRGHYSLGDEQEKISAGHVREALELVDLSTLLFLASGGALYIILHYI